MWRDQKGQIRKKKGAIIIKILNKKGLRNKNSPTNGAAATLRLAGKEPHLDGGGTVAATQGLLTQQHYP
jgi:hypothetical protein